MKLPELCPEPIRFISKDRYRILPLDTPPSKADGIIFLCPVCFKKNGGPEGTHSMLCWFTERGIPDDEKPGPGRWIATGDSFERLTLRASILTDCWHGYITDGETSTC